MHLRTIIMKSPACMAMLEFVPLPGNTLELNPDCMLGPKGMFILLGRLPLSISANMSLGSIVTGFKSRGEE